MVTQFRLPLPEVFFRWMLTCHSVFSSTAYISNSELVPDIISRLHNTWPTKRLAKMREWEEGKSKGAK
jgi:hypothetical protein